MHRAAHPAVVGIGAECPREARARCLAHAQEDGAHGERARLARELHDGPAQVLSAVQVRLAALGYRDELEALPEIRQELSDLAATCREALRDVRREIRGLRACASHDEGFATTVRALAERFGEETGVRVDADVADLPLPPQARTQAIRVVCEALTNVRKHAAATRVAVRAGRDGKTLVVEVADDGAGFEAAALPRGAEGFGLVAMRQRAEAVGGALEVESRPGRGTRVRLRLPDAEAEAPRP